ncbi:MAG TPA: cyclic nucleotide-binding domain-containing protein [Ilumatobacteraceae bacterium]|nr:cyclic nucleotide-binding domain-containing protein [Ilumatobacteraceae bacterium]
MRIEHSVTSISWIPSTSMKGIGGVAIKVGVAHDDPPPPDMLGADVDAGLQELIANDRLRFANHLRAAVEVGDDGTITGAQYLAGGRIGSTTLRVGTDLTFAAVSMPDRQAEPEFGEGWVRFTQTAGGRTGVPMPRPVSRAPFVQYRAPLAWSTLELTIFADGHSEHRLTGASKFPRHWVYDTEGTLVSKTGLIDMKDWASHAFGKHTPWGDEDSPAFVTAVETALERELANVVMRGAAQPKIRRVKEGDALTRQGDPGDELFLLLDGVLVVDVDGAEWAEVGPGAVLGERALLESGRRTSTLLARTPCRVAAVPAEQVDRDKLAELATNHRREVPDHVDKAARQLVEP